MRDDSDPNRTDRDSDTHCDRDRDDTSGAATDRDTDADAEADPSSLPLGVVVRLGPYTYFPFVFRPNRRQPPEWMHFKGGGGCIHEEHTKFGGPVRAIIRLGDACYETASGVGVRFCPACVCTLARACIPLVHKPQPRDRLSLEHALYTVGGVLDPAWEAGIASVCQYRGPAAQMCVTVPWATDEATAPPWNALPAPGDHPGWKPDMHGLTTPLNPADYKDRRLWIDHGGMTRPRDAFQVGLIPKCNEQTRIDWVGAPPDPAGGI